MNPRSSLDGLVPGADSVNKVTLILAILSGKNLQKLEAITAGDWIDGIERKFVFAIIPRVISSFRHTVVVQSFLFALIASL